MNSLSGAMSISCLRLLTRRNVNSFVESISRTTFLAFSVSCPISPAYNTEVALSNELLIGIPSWFTMTTPITPLWAWILLIVSSTSVADFGSCYPEFVIYQVFFGRALNFKYIIRWASRSAPCVPGRLRRNCRRRAPRSRRCPPPLRAASSGRTAAPAYELNWRRAGDRAWTPCCMIRGRKSRRCSKVSDCQDSTNNILEITLTKHEVSPFVTHVRLSSRFKDHSRTHIV